MTKAEEAVRHILRVMQDDGRLAYMLGWPSQSWQLLTEAEAERTGVDADELRRRIEANIRPIRIVAERGE